MARWAALLTIWLLAAGSVQAQQNPTEEACGLPAGGVIVSSLTYTLTADCTQTGVLNVNAAPAGQPRYTLTIDGAGRTIKLAAGTFAFASANDPHDRNSLVLRNLTLDGQAHKRPVVIDGPMSAENVTFRNHNATIITSASITLTNVLFSSNQFVGVGFGVNGGTLNIAVNGSATMTKAVFRYNRNMNIVVHSGAALTTEGCLSFSGNLAYNVVHSGVWSGAGAWTDNSTGECSGEIGNGDPVAIPTVPLSSCGLPASLVLIDSDRTFTLRGDCEGIVGLVVSQGKRVTIRGNGYRIGRNASLTISDAILDKAQFANYGTLTVSHSEMRNSLHLGLINYGTASFSNMRFQDNSAPAFAGLYYAGAIFLKGIGTFTDSRFDGVSGGDAALRANGSTVVLNLEGCIIFEGLAQGYPETLAQGGATLNDNREAAECNPTVGPRPRQPSNPEKSSRGSSSRAIEQPTATPLPPPEICDGKAGAIPVGAIACIFRHNDLLEVYGIDEQSRGFFMASATQAQIDAFCAGMVARSHDGRAAIHLSETGDVTVSVGPDYEGKVLRVTLVGGIHGEVVSFVTTYGPPPGLGELGPLKPCERAVELEGCRVITLHILNFRDAPAGNIFSALPYNVRLTALERTNDWFKVDYHGERGWVSADHVRPTGSCG